MPRGMVYDRWLFVNVGVLVLGGLLMVASASSFMAINSSGGPSSMLIRQSVHILIGLAGFSAALVLPWRRLDDPRLVRILVGVTFVALIFVLFMSPIGGARRWIPIGPINIQPSEFAKIIVVLFTAHLLASREGRINDFWAVPLPSIFVVGGMSLLIVIEPDLGSAVVLALVAGVMLFVGGLAWKSLSIVAGLGLGAACIAIVAEPFRVARIMSFLDPAADPLGTGFQLDQSLIALGSGSLTGVGLGQGQQKVFYIPAGYTDFIFSVIGEELGLLGTLAVLAAFLVLFWRGIRASRRAPDAFGAYLALGLTSLLVLQALFNISVCIGLLPTKGLPMPFVSYGGSSLVASMIAVGLLINISQHSN